VRVRRNAVLSLTARRAFRGPSGMPLEERPPRSRRIRRFRRRLAGQLLAHHRSPSPSSNRAIRLHSAPWSCRAGTTCAVLGRRLRLCAHAVIATLRSPRRAPARPASNTLRRRARICGGTGLAPCFVMRLPQGILGRRAAHDGDLFFFDLSLGRQLREGREPPFSPRIRRLGRKITSSSVSPDRARTAVSDRSV